MRGQAFDDVIARRFWLGQLSPEEEGRIQELAFENSDTFAFLESVEDDLIDEFIHGELSADEQRCFESHFLSQPGRSHNLKISKVLQRHLDNIPPDAYPPKRLPILVWFRAQNIWVRISITVGASGLVVILAVWLFNVIREARRPAQIHAGADAPAPIPSPQFKVSPSVRPTESPTHVQNNRKSLAPEKQKSFVPYALLAPSALSRGEGGGQPLPLAPNAQTMTIGLALITKRNFKSYEAALENEAGTELYVWPNLKVELLSSGKALKIDLPGALLKPQEFYRIVVSGVNSEGTKEVIHRYPFEAKQ